MEWQITSVFLHWEPYEQYEKAKRYDPEVWTPRSLGAQYATGDRWRNNSRKNEEMKPKLLWRASLTGKDPDAGIEWRQKEKGAAEDEMVR